MGQKLLEYRYTKFSDQIDSKNAEQCHATKRIDAFDTIGRAYRAEVALTNSGTDHCANRDRLPAFNSKRLAVTLLMRA